MSKTKRDPEQELRNRKRIESIALNVVTISFAIVIGAMIAFLGHWIVSDIYNDWIALNSDEQRNYALVGALLASFLCLLMLLIKNNDRVMELEKIVESEESNHGV